MSTMFRTAALSASVMVAALQGAVAISNVPILHFPAQERSGTYIEVELGTPPQVVSAIFDTGSATLAVGSSTTSGTNAICSADQLTDGSCVVGSYNPADSSSVSYTVSNCERTNSEGHCDFTVRYGTGAYGISGSLVNDVLRVGSLEATVSLGAISSMFDGWQQRPANGIWGVGMPAGNCNPTCEPSAMSTLLQQSGAMDTFAVCLGVAGSPGVLSLGGADQQYYTGDMVYTSFSGSEGYYTVDLTGVGINGQELCSGPGCVKPEGSTSPTIVDSGTPPLLIYTTAYNALANNQVSCESDSDCLITLQMGDICINSAGLMTCDGTCQLDTSLVREATSAINGGATIVGNAAINQLYIEFDRAGSQLGFGQRSEQQCSVPCSAFISRSACQEAQTCSWSGSSCTGGSGQGNSAAGSTVSSGNCLVNSGNSGSNPAPAPPPSDNYNDDETPPPPPPTSDSYSDDYSPPPPPPTSDNDNYGDDDGSYDIEAQQNQVQQNQVQPNQVQPNQANGRTQTATATAPASKPSSSLSAGVIAAVVIASIGTLGSLVALYHIRARATAVDESAVPLV